jgi:hypothetical protein
MYGVPVPFQLQPEDAEIWINFARPFEKDNQFIRLTVESLTGLPLSVGQANGIMQDCCNSLSAIIPDDGAAGGMSHCNVGTWSGVGPYTPPVRINFTGTQAGGILDSNVPYLPPQDTALYWRGGDSRWSGRTYLPYVAVTDMQLGSFLTTAGRVKFQACGIELDLSCTTALTAPRIWHSATAHQPQSREVILHSGTRQLIASQRRRRSHL